MKIEMELVTLSGGQTLYVHTKTQCLLDDSCAIHNPSDHHMRGFPQFWREDRFMMERVCPHGVGHPDPDQIKYWDRVLGRERASIEAYHGCDGCCGKEEDDSA